MLLCTDKVCLCALHFSAVEEKSLVPDLPRGSKWGNGVPWQRDQVIELDGMCLAAISCQNSGWKCAILAVENFSVALACT